MSVYRSLPGDGSRIKDKRPQRMPTQGEGPGHRSHGRPGANRGLRPDPRRRPVSRPAKRPVRDGAVVLAAGDANRVRLGAGIVAMDIRK